MSKNKRVLYVTYGGGHARMLKPVIQRMTEDTNFEIHVLALNTAYDELKGLPVQLWQYRDFFGTDKDVIRYGEQCLPSLEKVIDRAESVCYLGANFRDLVNRYGEAEAAKMFREGGRYIFEPYDSLQLILKKIGPDLVVTTNSPRSEKMAIVVARELGIPSVAFIDMFGIRCESWFRRNDFADLILVLSERVREYYIARGREPAHIAVTGNPSFDVLSRYYASHRDAIEAFRNTAPYTVLWASQPEPAFLAEFGTKGDVDFPLKAESVILAAMQEHPEWRLIARNHPSEIPRSYPEHVRVSPQGEDIEKLLAKVHVVLTPSSTIGFQGVVMGANLITVDCSVLTPTMPYADMGYSYGVDGFEGIRGALEYFAVPENRVSEPAYQETDAAGKALRAILQLVG